MIIKSADKGSLIVVNNAKGLVEHALQASLYYSRQLINLMKNTNQL